jgi:hypothetical protein
VYRVFEARRLDKITKEIDQLRPAKLQGQEDEEKLVKETEERPGR